jgi:HlyD family secretion protein
VRYRLAFQRSSAAWLLVAALAAGGCGEDDSRLVLVGTVERTLIELVAPASETIVECPHERGDRVPAGEVLVRLDPTLAEAEVASANATLAGARTRELVAEHDLGRARGLRERNVTSPQQLDRAELSRDEAIALRREAEARLAVAEKHLRERALSAPVPGVVDQLPFDPGERVSAGSVVAVLLSDEKPWVRVWIPEPSVALVAPGVRAEVRIDGLTATLEGRVLDVAREPEFTPHFALTERDRVHLVYETRIGLVDAPPELRPGVPAQVRLLVAEGPESAVERGG